jgi:uncharacterized membrane protein
MPGGRCSNFEGYVSESWQSWLERWQSAGLLDALTAERILAFETSQEKPKQLRWPVLIAVGLGALMLGAGVLLFVSAHWDELSPAQRFTLVLTLVAIFHVAGAILSSRFAVLATALHAVGTISLGAGIFLAAQIFNLQEHWPGGVMLWALGAWMAWGLRRDWVQAGFVALLTPAWLASEWIDATERLDGHLVLGQGLLLLSVTYLTATFADRGGSVRGTLAWIGGIALIPTAAMAMPEAWYWGSPLPLRLQVWGTGLAILLPLALALWLRGKSAWGNLVAALWIAVLGFIPAKGTDSESALHYIVRVIGPYIWCGIAALALIAWGVQEGRKERINLGVLGFGVTVIVFYFSQVMDKLGRSLSLIGLGLLFLVLGWALERTRRQLVARLKGANP